ncbi:MAG: glycosyl hydrolase [Patescibacteria group bacterium]
MHERFLLGEPLSEERFAHPNRDFGILPFWFWNGDLRPDEMRREMEELKAKGMPGFFIHSRFGLTVPYLSDDWFARVRQVMAWAEELDLTAWIYDEKNWPSGTAGWEVPRQYPDLAQRYLEMIVKDVPGPHFVYLEGTDGRYLDMEDTEPVCAFAVSAREYEEGITRIIDLTPNLSFEKIVPWEAPAGDWKLLYFVERRAKWYIDALNPESTRRFLEMTHERYAAEVGSYFGRVMPGFYTDEPACHYFEVDLNNRIVPWTKGMFKLFRGKNGYDLRSVLPALFLPFGEKTAQIRYDFWHTLAEQYRASYYGQIQDWCKRHGVLATGHILHEEYLRSQMRCEGNLFHIFKHFDLVGVDHLYPIIGTARDPEQHVALKLASSAAHHYGTRLLCESLAGSFWDVTMERMKWLADWEYVLGVNLFNPHGFHYSIEGERKRDWPPSQFYHHTWWSDYRLFQDYITRLSYILSGGRHVAEVAVLYPISAEWANYTPQCSGPVSGAIEGDFAYLADTLLRLHYDYDYLDEDTLAETKIEDGRLKVADEAYACLILPAATHIKETTMAQMERFVDAGGTVLATTLLPEASVDTRRSLADRAAALFGQEPAAMKAAYLNGLTAVTAYDRQHRDGRAIFLAGPGLRQANPHRELGTILRERFAPDVIIDDPDVFYLHRVKDGRQVYFFVNPSPKERIVHLSLLGSVAPEIWDTDDGAIRPLWVYRHRDNRTEFTLALPSYGSAVVVGVDREREHLEACNMVVEECGQGIASGYATAPGEIRAAAGDRSWRTVVDAQPATLTAGERWRFRAEGRNALIKDSWRVKIAGTADDYSRPEFDDSSWMTFTRGGWEAQVPGGADDAAYPVVLWYRTGFEAEFVPADLRLVIDGFKGDAVIYLNGARLNDFQPSSIDAMMQEIPLASLTRTGRNVLAIRLVVNSRSEGLLDLLKLMGSFALAERGGGYVIVPEPREVATSSWTCFGYPFFSGTGVYEQEIEIPASFGGRKILVAVDCGDDLAELLVDGVSLGKRPWHPYELDASAALQPGRHRLTVKITNSMANLLNGNPKPSGLLGPVEVRAFPRCTVALSGDSVLVK